MNGASHNLLPVEVARARILSEARPMPQETIAIENARDRILAFDLAARLTQPPFDASAMDGYAIRAADIAVLPARLTVIGASTAGHPFAGKVGPGQAVRIFTGAVVPSGADAIVIQENVERDGDTVTLSVSEIEPEYIRLRGCDFAAGEVLLRSGRRLGARELALAAAMGYSHVSVRRLPRVAILSTGDELVASGTLPGPGQIIAANHLGVAALVARAGGEPVLLGIARDTRESLAKHIAQAQDTDILVTIGGASVGEHDLVGPVLTSRGMKLAFWKIAMRPGKPLLYGRLGSQHVLGLPGNPVSALVTARVFLVPLIHALLASTPMSEERVARAGVPLAANGPRQHYMRATLRPTKDCLAEVTPVRSQDSSLLSPLATADCLIVRPINAPAVAAGVIVRILALDF
jgi:molybdopterin molybdotransferase